MRSSTPQPGTVAWICLAVSAYSHAPPSARSSRATPVTVAYRRPIDATDSATRCGSSRSSGAGFPVSIWQKSQGLVHWSPPIRKVASRSSQHSKMFGQPASSHTVCRPPRRTRSFSALYSGPVRSRVLIHGGFFSIRVWLFLVSSRRSRRPSGATTTTSADVLAHPGLWCGPRRRGRRREQAVRAPYRAPGGGAERVRQVLLHGRDHVGNGHGAPRFPGQGRHLRVPDPAGHDAVAPGRVAVAVEREAERGNAARDPDADRRNLPVWPRLPAMPMHPDAAAS